MGIYSKKYIEKLNKDLREFLLEKWFEGSGNIINRRHGLEREMQWN